MGVLEMKAYSRWWAPSCFVLGAALAPSLCGAQPLEQSEVPEPLRPWVGWALHDSQGYGCTWIDEETLCVWPGRLELELGATGGTFRQEVSADRRVLMPLPGDASHYPHDIRVDGREHPIVEPEGQGLPYVRLVPGNHVIEGRFRFASLPELLRIPPSVGIVALSIDGKAVPSPKRDEEGKLWLQKERAAGSGEEGLKEGHLELEVHRRILDALPLEVTTQIELRAAGEPREVSLGNVTLGGSKSVSVSSGVAVRLAPNGDLVAQVRAGTYTITTVSYLATPPKALSPPKQAEPWPETETWVWVPDESLRQVEVEGAVAIDPSRTTLPESWRAHPAYVVDPQVALRFSTTRRGQGEILSNALRLHRSFWLDVDGGGYTVRDSIDGEMRQGWRLELLEGALGHVSVNGEDRLITEVQSGGVELRHRAVSIQADSRVVGEIYDLAAVGWSEDVDALSATLNLPPGWTLLTATGVDRVEGTWVAQWNLWGLFFVLLVSLATAKIVGWHWGLVALVALPLAYHEEDAPFVSWIVLLIAAALFRALRGGKPAVWAGRFFSLALLLLATLILIFSVSQLRAVLYPFLAHAGPSYPVGGLRLDRQRLSRQALHEPAPAAEAPAEERLEDEVAPGSEEWETRVESLRSLGYGDVDQDQSRGAKVSRAKVGWVDPNAVIQTGPGLPTWNHRHWELQFAGPVDRDHRIGLVMLAPWATRALGVLRVGLLIALLIAFLRLRWRGAPSASEDGPAAPKGGSAATAGAAATALLLALSTSVMSMFLPLETARAQSFPTDAQLGALRERLERKPACSPDCVLASEVEIRAVGDALDIVAEVHADARGAYRLPGPADRWVPANVRVDGVSSSALALRSDGFLYLRLEAGRHKVELAGSLEGVEELTLSFGESPRSVHVEAGEFTVEGLRQDGRAAESIQLRRKLRPDVAGDEVESLQLASWVLVRRRLEIGVRWTIHSSVERITPLGAPIVLRIPLLQGESVTESDVQVESGNVLVSLGRDDSSFEWSSAIEPREAIELEARQGASYSERWTLACSPIWQCEASGLDPIELVAADESEERWEPTYQPWPGEKLALRFHRPKAAQGLSTTIDEATLELRPGIRLLDSTLTLVIRTSHGRSHELILPEGAEPTSLAVRGEARPIQRDGRTIRVTLPPGASTLKLAWKQNEAIAAVIQAPEVDLGAEAVNVKVRIQRPSDRWLLWTTGPSWGTAILFWPYLLLVLFTALLLSRIPRSPLRWYDWALLGFGLTQIPVLAALPIVLWFFVIEYRSRTGLEPPTPLLFNLRQLAVGVFTLVALGCLYAAVHAGLLLQPDLQIETMDGGDGLSFYVDRVGGILPQPRVVSVPLWIWRAIMLLWSLWLAARLVGWSQWAWRAFAVGGLWRAMPPRPKRPRSAPAAPSAAERGVPDARADTPNEAAVGPKETTPGASPEANEASESTPKGDG